MLKQQSHIVAPIPDELRTRALYTVGELRERGKADREAIDTLYGLIVELTEQGLDFFFLEPLRRLRVTGEDGLPPLRQDQGQRAARLLH